MSRVSSDSGAGSGGGSNGSGSSGGGGSGGGGNGGGGGGTTMSQLTAKCQASLSASLKACSFKAGGGGGGKPSDRCCKALTEGMSDSCAEDAAKALAKDDKGLSKQL